MPDIKTPLKNEHKKTAKKEELDQVGQDHSEKYSQKMMRKNKKEEAILKSQTKSIQNHVPATIHQVQILNILIQIHIIHMITRIIVLPVQIPVIHPVQKVLQVQQAIE